MKLLFEILGMTAACNLDCGYCEWKKEPMRSLAPEEFARADSHLRRAAHLVRERFPSVVFVEYSGGEPYVYPRIVDSVLEAFPDRWVRISTNGTRIDSRAISRLVGRKVYLALSLDGSTDQANFPRFRGNGDLLQKVLGTVQTLLSEGVQVMLLCTLTRHNIDLFPSFVGFLEDRFPPFIERGLLTLPAHFVSEYHRGGSRPAIPQIEGFEDFVHGRGATSLLIAPIR
ncbi:MAG: radical SAM protein, partial [Deltaproteobacteria bacterium]|nr:radical SAM protein [Deltaproteobacteria bacterium]